MSSSGGSSRSHQNRDRERGDRDRDRRRDRDRDKRDKDDTPTKSILTKSKSPIKIEQQINIKKRDDNTEQSSSIQQSPQPKIQQNTIITNTAQQSAHASRLAEATKQLTSQLQPLSPSFLQKSAHENTTKSSEELSPILSSSLLHPVIYSPVKILTKYKLNIESALKLLTKDENFMVVGVLGGQSTGKSTILSTLITPDSSQYPFEVQTETNFCLGNHQTRGIDIYVTPDRFIYLDTQPLQSISIVCELIEKNAHIPSQYNSYEHYHHVHCLKMIIFLISVCHVVLIVQESKSIDVPICNLIRTALMLKNRVPDISNPVPTNDIESHEFISKFIFIFNKLSELDFDIQSLDKPLSLLMGTKMREHPIETKPIPDRFIYTQQSQSQQPIFTSIPNYNDSIDQLKKRLLIMKSQHKFAKPLTEREWLTNAAKIHDFIADYDYIESYNKVLQSKKYKESSYK